MIEARHPPWVWAALLIGLAYCVVGRVFALPTAHEQAWRLAAWLVSGAAFAAHIWYEHVRLHNPPRSLALHTAVAVALGAFALAVAGALHSLAVSSSIRPAWLLAFLVWPAVTAVPAFLVALATAAVLGRVQGRPGHEV